MPGPEECFESKQALNARFRESNRNISPIEKDYHTNLKECKNDILFIAYFPPEPWYNIFAKYMTPAVYYPS